MVTSKEIPEKGKIIITIQNILSKEKLKWSLNLKDKLKQLQSSSGTEIYLLTKKGCISTMCFVIRNIDNRVRKEDNIECFRNKYASGSEIQRRTADGSRCEGTGSGLADACCDRKICIDNLG